MRSVKIAASIAAVSLGLGMTIAAANAQQVANVQSCLSVASQVKAALEANPQSPNHDAAMRERNNGLLYCNSSFYAQGIQHYNRALALLGQNTDTPAAH